MFIIFNESLQMFHDEESVFLSDLKNRLLQHLLVKRNKSESLFADNKTSVNL